MTILVSGASGVVGYGILRSLRQAREKHQLLGTSIYTDSVAPVFCDLFEQAPLTEHDGYMSWLCSMINKHRVDAVIPGIEADMFKWSDERASLEKTRACAILNNRECVRACWDKWTFYERLKMEFPQLAIDSRINGDYDVFARELGAPFLLKPRRGFASKGIVKVDSEKTFLIHAPMLGRELMAQAIVGTDAEEYTTSGFFDSESVLCCHMTLKRRLSAEGFTEKALVTEVEGIQEVLRGLAQVFRPVGATNFQFRRHGRGIKLLEINPRISSATSIRSAFGYNESLMSIDYFLNGVRPVQPALRKGLAVRYWEDHVFYDRTDF